MPRGKVAKNIYEKMGGNMLRKKESRRQDSASLRWIMIIPQISWINALL